MHRHGKGPLNRRQINSRDVTRLLIRAEAHLGTVFSFNDDTNVAIDKTNTRRVHRDEQRTASNHQIPRSQLQSTVDDVVPLINTQRTPTHATQQATSRNLFQRRCMIGRVGRTSEVSDFAVGAHQFIDDRTRRLGARCRLDKRELRARIPNCG